GLHLEPLALTGVERRPGGEHLQRDPAAQGDLLGLVDDPHAPAADLADDPEVAHPRARRQPAVRTGDRALTPRAGRRGQPAPPPPARAGGAGAGAANGRPGWPSGAALTHRRTSSIGDAVPVPVPAESSDDDGTSVSGPAPGWPGPWPASIRDMSHRLVARR